MIRRLVFRLWFALALIAPAFGQNAGEIRFCLRADPKTFDPLAVEDDNSETVRYLTAGVLLRVNRVTQQLIPELAVSWKVDREGRRIAFQLRRNVAFSDGAPFSADDVAFSMGRLMDPKLHSATADAFRSSDAPPQVTVEAPDKVSILFAAPVSSLERLFDQVPILPARPRQKSAVLGPFYVADYKPGVEVLLQRNPNYWKTDARGVRLPYVQRVRLLIQQSRDIELVRFRRGEIDLIDSLDPETFEELARVAPGSARDAGPSLESEMMWFNQTPSAPIASYKKAWFTSQAFRLAVSAAVNRADLCRVIFKGHAQPAEGPISPANRFWFNSALKPPAHDPASAMRGLERDGFRLRNGALYDRDGHPVEFSVVTNAGNRTRERMAAMIQQDLASIGMRLNVVTLDFPSLIERMTRSYNYEACLLGLTNVDLDPSAQMNVWLSSGDNHQWNPNQKAPATAWEAEIDRLMRAQASEPRPAARKRLFDRVQQIVSEEAPFIYLVNKNSLMALSPEIRNTAPAAVRPQTYWNVEVLTKTTHPVESK
jgi:peptide/nickel transport system substrate-binding protein